MTTTSPPLQPLLLPAGTPPPPLPEVKPNRAYFLRKSNESGLFSGESLKQVDADRYQAIVDLLADGVISRRKIAQICKVSSHTVQAIASARESDIASLRKTISTKARHLVRLTLDRIEEMLLADGDTLTARDLAALVRELGTHAELLDGNPTARIAGETVGGEHSEYSRALEALRVQWAEIRAKAVTVHPAPRMDLGAENRRAIGAAHPSGAVIELPAVGRPGADPALQIPADDAQVSTPSRAADVPGSDVESVVIESQTPGGQGHA